MRRLIALLTLTGALSVAACDDTRGSNDPEFADPAMEAPVATAAEEVEVPAVAPDVVDTPPADLTRLPPEDRSSEESVQPQSETLFY
jgi:hypothetical protein